tara:strand:+ start:2986 stop:4161 length:1176 start_codon:yes stop_codon:yes gene_type:complete
MVDKLTKNIKKVKPLNFDFQSTTPCLQEVISSMSPYWEEFWGNPSSRNNRNALTASAAVKVATDKIAALLHILPEQIIFTSGATEANNLAILGHARANSKQKGEKGHIITLSTEHQAVLGPIRQLKLEGFNVTEIDPSSNGIIDINKCIDAIQENTFLLSIMLANNEIGVLQPISDLSEICRENEIIFHSDVVQAVENIRVFPDYSGLDLLTISSHKIYGPKGIGALIYDKSVPINPIQWGGGQQNGLRPGTIPVPLVVGFAKALELTLVNQEKRAKKIKDLRDYFLNGIIRQTSEIIVNGSMVHRLPNNLNISFPNLKGNRLHQSLRRYISCSSGSACSNGEPSHVLKGIGRNVKEAEASIRLSLGRSTTKEEVDLAIEIIGYLVNELKC